MKRQTIYLALVIACTLLLSGLARAQVGGYDLTWSTIDGGGGSSTSGNYTLDGAIGQADAGNLSGGVYTLNGGFWIAPASAVADTFVYLPLVLK